MKRQNLRDLIFLPIVVFLLIAGFSFGMGWLAKFGAEMALEAAIERAINELNADIQDLKARQTGPMSSANYAREQRKYWESEVSEYDPDIQAATAALNEAETQLAGAEVRKAIAEADISTALDMLYALGGSSSTSDGAIDHWREKLREARARKSAAEADIGMAQSAISSAKASKNIAESERNIAQWWVNYYQDWENHYNSIVADLQAQIGEKEAQIEAKRREIQAIREQYQQNNPDFNPNDNEGGPNDNQGGPNDHEGGEYNDEGGPNDDEGGPND